MTTFLEAKQRVARPVGASGIASQLAIAGVAIVDALEDLDTRHDWEWTRQTLNDISVSINVDEYSLTPNHANDPPCKKIYSALLVGTSTRTLYNIRQRGIDRMYGSRSGATGIYDEIRTATGLAIKIVPNPSVIDTLRVRTYLHIRTEYIDAETLVYPPRYEAALFALARYYFLIDRDAEDARASTYLQKAEALIAQAIIDDKHAPDEDIRLVPSDEWVGSFGSFDSFGLDGELVGGYGEDYGISYGG